MKNLDIAVRKKTRSTSLSPPASLKPDALALEVPPPQSKSVWPRLILAVSLLAVLAAGFLAIVILPEARIKLLVRGEPVAREFEITVDANASTPSMANLAIPGKRVTAEKSGKKSFSSTGTKNIGQKASGFVNIYNFSKSTLILKAQTTVLTANGRQYFFTQDVANIRPTALLGLEDQEVDVTSLIPPVPIVAASPGETYNLEQGARLEITNEAFGHQAKTLYAAAAAAVGGGTTKEIKVVTEGDVAAALKNLTAELIAEGKKEAAGEKGTLELLDQALTFEVIEEKAWANPGTETAEFGVEAKVKIQGLAYDRTQALEVARQRIERLLPENQRLQAGSAAFDANFITVNLQQGIGILKIRFEGQIVYEIDRQDFLRKIRGKNAEEIREIALSRPEVEEVEIRFYPFWVRHAPKFLKKLNLEVEQTGS